MRPKMKTGFGLAVIGFAACAVMMFAQPPQPVAQEGRGGPPPGFQGRGGGAGGRGGGSLARSPGRKVVLAWADTMNGIAQHDFTSHALAMMERIGYEANLWDTYIRTDSAIISYSPTKTDGSPASGGPNLGNVDAIFFLGHREIALTDDQKADLLTFVQDGGGFVAAHTALTALSSWPEFGEMMGGTYGGHPRVEPPDMIINEASDFPATKHFPATFEFNDEHYLAGGFSRENSRVLLRLDTSKFTPEQLAQVPNGDYPVAWAKMYGQGRVFYSSFSHDTRLWDDPRVTEMYVEAMKWALGLTDGDVTPRPFPSE